MSTPSHYFAQTAQARYQLVGGDIAHIRLPGEVTSGALCLLEVEIPPHGGPPHHLHHRESETFYILSGEFDFLVGDASIRAGVGDVVHGPSGVAHSFRNCADQPGRLLVVCQPAGFERFLAELALLPLDAAPDPQQMARIGERYGIEFVPRPAESGPSA